MAWSETFRSSVTALLTGSVTNPSTRPTEVSQWGTIHAYYVSQKMQVQRSLKSCIDKLQDSPAQRLPGLHCCWSLTVRLYMLSMQMDMLETMAWPVSLVSICRDSVLFMCLLSFES